MFPCIDFDQHFQDFYSQWYIDHADEYKNADEAEADMPRIHLQYLNTPAPWLDGVTPGAYFTQFEDPKDLVDWLIAYTDRGCRCPTCYWIRSKRSAAPAKSGCWPC